MLDQAIRDHLEKLHDDYSKKVQEVYTQIVSNCKDVENLIDSMAEHRKWVAQKLERHASAEVIRNLEQQIKAADTRHRELEKRVTTLEKQGVRIIKGGKDKGGL